jgi:hypothetical protein
LAIVLLFNRIVISTLLSPSSNGRKTRVRFPEEDVVSKVISTPKVDNNEKENMFYTEDDLLKFRQEFIYEREATIENKIVDYFELKFGRIWRIFDCGAGGQSIDKS